MSVLEGVLGVSGAIELATFLPISLAAYWVRVFRLPVGERGYALYRAIVAVFGLVFGIIVLTVAAPGGLGLAGQAYVAIAFESPLSFHLGFTAIFVGELIWLSRELRLLAKARAERAAEAEKVARGHDWPQGSDLPV